MAFAVPIVKQNYALYGSGSSATSSGANSASSSPVGSPPKLAVHAAPAKRPPLSRSASARATPILVDARMQSPPSSEAAKTPITRNANSFTSFHEALVVRLTKAVRKISR